MSERWHLQLGSLYRPSGASIVHRNGRTAQWIFSKELPDDDNGPASPQGEPAGYGFGPRTPDELKKLFRELADRWREDTDIHSSPTQIFMHADYQRIIGLGAPAVPLILAELERTGGHWAWALCAITGENPMAEGDAGKVAQINERWLEWGRSRGLI